MTARARLVLARTAMHEREDGVRGAEAVVLRLVERLSLAGELPNELALAAGRLAERRAQLESARMHFSEVEREAVER